MKRGKPPSKRREPSKRIERIGVEIPAPTRKQSSDLARTFKSLVVATLGIPPGSAITKRAFVKKGPKR